MNKLLTFILIIWSASVFGQNKKQYEGYYKYNDTVESSVIGINTTPANSKRFDMVGDARILGSTSDNTAAMLQMRAANDGVRFYFRNDGNFGIGTESPQSQFENLGSGIKTILRNSTSTSYTGMDIYNDQNSASRALELAYTGSAYASSFLTNGVTGEQGVVTTRGSQPLLLGTGNTLRLIINSSGQIGVNTNAPATTSLMDLTSTTLGFLAPRMTTVQRDAISSPATGLLVFNTTDSSYQQYRGLSGWSSLGAGAGGTPGGADREIQINNAGAFGTQTWKISSTGELSNVSDQGDFKIQVDGNVFQQGTTSDGSATLHRWTAANGGNRMWLWSDGHLGFNSSVYPEATITIIGETLPTIFRTSSSGSYSRIQARNDINSSSRSFDYGYTGSAYGAFWTSGYSGEQGLLGTTGNFPISFATNNTQRMLLATTGATWAIRNIEKQGADVASVAGAIALGTDGNAFEITGTNAITLISNVNWQNGAIVTLIFTSTATLTDGTANSGTDIGMELAGNTNFVASAGATLTLILSEIGGTQRWRERARSVQ